MQPQALFTIGTLLEYVIKYKKLYVDTKNINYAD